MKNRKVILIMFMLYSIGTFASDSALKISKEQFGDRWPVSVNEGVLICFPVKDSVVFMANGKKYGINGYAKSFTKEYGFERIESIWLDDPKYKGLKINIDPLLENGKKHCGITK